MYSNLSTFADLLEVFGKKIKLYFDTLCKQGVLKFEFCVLYSF